METKLAIAWYRADQWEKLRLISVDRENIEGEFELWRVNAQEKLIELRRSGVNIQMIDVDVDELLNWCAIRNQSVDSKSRAAFAAFKLRELQGDN